MESVSQPSRMTIGVDIGQKHDPTAVCVAEAQARSSGEHFMVRHLERVPLGTPYPEVAERIDGIATAVYERTEQSPIVYVDATGVGQPVVDLLHAKVGRGWSLVAVTFTASRKRRLRPGTSHTIDARQGVSRQPSSGFDARPTDPSSVDV